MIEILTTIIIVAVIVAVIAYCSPSPVTNKTCHNCRFYDEPNCTNRKVMDKLMSSIPVEIEVPSEPCTQWDWKGSE